jgi:hypothetical protein
MKIHKDKYAWRVSVVAILGILIPMFVFATSDVRASFRSVATVEVPEMQVPTVVEISAPSYIEADRHIGIYNVTDDVFVPYDVRYTTPRVTPVTISSYGFSATELAGLTDLVTSTTVDFLLQETATTRSIVTLIYTFDAPITSDTLRMSLSQYAVLPENVSVRAQVDGVMQRVVANISPKTNTVTFPQLTAATWEVTLEYVQPLRFTELSFVNKNNAASSASVRFLAHPDTAYELYHNPEVIVAQNVGERPNILNATDIVTARMTDDRVNPLYTPADTDKDGVIDATDNCPRLENGDQEDVDGNGRGDACEDFDRDGVVNQLDNCRDMPNRTQEDIDRDGIGDTCDTEESRITERYPWIVWVALTGAALVFVGLFFMALRHKEPEPIDGTTPTSPTV